MAKSYLAFQEQPSPGKMRTRRWHVEARGEWLGSVYWYAPWRRYTFSSRQGIVFDASCLRELADFCEAETNKRKEERKRELLVDAADESGAVAQ